jgi:tetratricopeptide (TPR) repeat protein
MRRLLILFLIAVIGCASPLLEQLKVDIKYGRIDDAVQHGKEAVAQEPDNPTAHFLLGQAYIHASKWIDATSQLDEAIRLDSSYIMSEMKKSPDFYWTTYYNAGIEFMQQEDYQRASQLFIQATEIDPSKPEAYNNLGFTYLMLGDDQKMIENYTRSTEIDSTNVDAYYNLGFYYNGRGDHEKALSHMEKAEDLAVPELEKYRTQFLGLSSRSFTPTEGDEYIESLVSQEDSLRRQTLTKDLKKEDVERGSRLLKEIDKRTTRLAEILSTKGLIYLNTEREEEAEEILKESLRHVKDDSDTHFYLILALQRQERYDEALPYLERMADLDPYDIRTWFQLGVSHFRTREYDEALKAFSKVIQLNPEYADAYVNRGNVYTSKANFMRDEGRTQEERALRELAKKDFEKADELEKAGEPD